MKLPKFNYERPSSIKQVLSLLHDNENAKVLAGGQTLIPMLAFRMAAPSLLVDIGDLSELTGIDIGPTGIRLGSRVRWCDIEAHKRLADANPLLSEMIGHVAHYQVRNRGTVGGSLAHSDPSAEMPGFAVTSDAEIHLLSVSGTRILPAASFTIGTLETAIRPDELIVAVQIPPWKPARRWGFQEFARRRGDFAIAGIAIFYDQDAAGRSTNSHIGVIGVTDYPRRLPSAEAELNGRIVDETTIRIVAKAAGAAVEPMSDLQAGVDYRRALVELLTARVLTRTVQPMLRTD